MRLYGWTAFTHYSLWGLEFLFLQAILPITLVIGGNLVVAVALAYPKFHAYWKKIYSLAFANLLLYPITIALAFIGKVDPSRNPTSAQATFGVLLCGGSLLLSIAYGSFWAWRMKGLRWFAVSVLLVSVWVLLGAEFVAVMSFSGRWL